MGNTEYYRKIFAENLNKIMQLRNKTQSDIVNDLGLNKSAVSTWVNGTRLPRMDKVDLLAQYFHVNRSDLIEEKTDNDTSDPYKTDSYKIPILGEIVAGMPIDAYENVLGYEDITLDMAAKGEHYALKVKGSSMEPRICDGDIVIVRVQPDVESGDIAVVFVNGNEATMKKVLKHDNGITLVALNPIVYEPHFYTNEEVENLPITISGKVIELRASF